MGINNCPNRSGSALKLHPWRDGFKFTRKLLDKDSDEVKAVHVHFEEKEVEFVLEDEQLVELFEAIGSELPNMEHLSVQLDVALHFPLLSPCVPPLQALTSALMGGRSLKSLTLLGLRLQGDDLDVRGLAEAIRIHPCLQWFQMEQCSLSKDSHLVEIKEALMLSRSLTHRDLDSNVIIENADTSGYSKSSNVQDEPEEAATPFWAPSLLCCFRPQIWCV